MPHLVSQHLLSKVELLVKGVKQTPALASPVEELEGEQLVILVLYQVDLKHNKWSVRLRFSYALTCSMLAVSRTCN